MLSLDDALRPRDGGTLVFQTYKTENVPAWIERCRDSVQHWAKMHGYDYTFLDDGFFTIASGQLREKIGSADSLLPLTDYCRLLWARRFLERGWARVIWADVDMLVFVPEKLLLGDHGPFAFCKEVAVFGRDGGVQSERRVNNSLFLFDRGNPFLDYYIDACERLVHAPWELKSTSLGTSFLVGAHAASPLPLIRHVGCYAPNILWDLYERRPTWVLAYALAIGQPAFAANLCRSMGPGARRPIGDEVFAGVVDLLLTSGGRAANVLEKQA